MKISLVIPVYNALDDVKKCLISIAENYNKSYEVLVVDDCSQEETSSFLKEFVSDKDFLKLYTNKENLGFIKTCNFAMNQARGDVVVLLNSDTQIPSNFAEKIIKCFDSNKSIGVACPIPSDSGHFSFGMPKGYDIEKINLLLENKHKCVYPKMPSCNGFCFCIRKQVVEKIGGFDEVFGKGYCEEIDFCYRTIKEGFECVLIDNLYVLHKRHSSFGSDQRQKLLKINRKIFNAKWGYFGEIWKKENKYECPVNKIKKELFPIRYFSQKIYTEFLYQNRITKSGKRIIKICKIPVWRRKLK